MIVQYDDAEYCLETLAKHAEYFSSINPSTFDEDADGRLDLTHRGLAMRLVLDMFVGDVCAFDLPLPVLLEMRPMLEELLAEPGWLELFDTDFHCNVISLKLEEEREGVRCGECDQINRWLRPPDYWKLDWDARRGYCSCDYERDPFGRRRPRVERPDIYYY